MINPTRIDDFNESDTPWLIEGFVCPSLTLLSGQPKYGKSLLAGHLAVSLITGTSLVGREVTGNSHTVGWMGFDANWKNELKNHWSGKVSNKILLYNAIRTHSTQTWEELRQSLEREGVTVLIIDHLYGLAGTLTMNDAENVARIMSLIRPIYEESKIAVVLLSQAGKGENTRGRAAHSVAIEAEARALIRITFKGKGGLRGIELTSNTRGEEDFRATLTNEVFSTAQVIKKEKIERESPNLVRKLLKEVNHLQLKNWSELGREMARLGYSVNAGAARTMSTRWRNQSLIKQENGFFVAGDSLLSYEELNQYGEINVATDYLPAEGERVNG